MAVELRFLSIVIPIDRINESRFPRGFKGRLEDVATGMGKICWYDDHLYCEVAMSPDIVGVACEFWEQHGLQTTETIDGVLRWKDLCVIDYYRGLTLPCEWVCVDQGEHIAWHADHDKGKTVCGDDTFGQSKAVFLPEEVLRDATIKVVDVVGPEDTEGG